MKQKLTAEPKNPRPEIANIDDDTFDGSTDPEALDNTVQRAELKVKELGELLPSSTVLEELLKNISKGKWFFTDSVAYDRMIRSDESIYAIAIPCFKYREKPISEANAKLIALSPSLAKEVLALRKENEELKKIFTERGAKLREFQESLEMLVNAAQGTEITNWPQMKIASSLLNK